MVCDVLMDQEIFSGIGNIIKNEVLFKLRIHPETRAGELSPKEQGELVKEARKYALQFYKWKKSGELKRNWKIFRKKRCPRCDLPVQKRPTGKGKRLSHFCRSCQKRHL
jgi:endonuclease-8